MSLCRPKWGRFLKIEYSKIFIANAGIITENRLDFYVGKHGSSVLQEALLAQKLWDANKLI